MNQAQNIGRVEREVDESCHVKQHFSRKLKLQIVDLAQLMAATLASGQTIYWLGNGGSAADAQHLAAELVGKLHRPRRALASVAFSENASILTAVGNDYSFEDIFARQVEALVRPGDMLVGISTSGNSPNVIRAIRRANEMRAVTVGWTGTPGGQLANTAQICLCIPSSNTQRIQEAYMTMGHIVCGLLEDFLKSDGRKSPSAKRTRKRS